MALMQAIEVSAFCLPSQAPWVPPKPLANGGLIRLIVRDGERMGQAGLFGLSDHWKRRLAFGDPLEELSRIVDF